jgi:hypothetical protein
VPGTVDAPDTSPIEVGLAFKSDSAGNITGVRFYKSSNDTGTHLGHLWTSAGALLGTVTFSGETASGWQQASFATPISIQANTTYVVSYYAPNGNYSANNGYFSSAGVDSPPLHALSNVTTSNGLYNYVTGGGFPNQTFGATNYWVDVVFK